MTKLELSESDATVLREALEKMLKELSYEIADTDSKDFRDGLKARRDALARVERALAGGGGKT